MAIDGRYLPGGGRLNVTWVRDGQKMDSLLRDGNVGPQSMLRALPTRTREVTRPGDFIEISSGGDPVYILGIRVGLKR